MKKEREAKIKLDKLLKMKPSEYKNVSNKEKMKLNFNIIMKKLKEKLLKKNRRIGMNVCFGLF